MSATTCAPVSVEFINPFLTSSINVFRTMAGCELTRGKPYLTDGTHPTHEISGVIGLSGKAIGTVVLSLGETVALKVTEGMLGEAPKGMDGDVVDAIGELTNMIAGAAKAQMEHLEMSVSLPSVIIGRDHRVGFPGDIQPIAIPFESEWGPVCVEVGLREKVG
jgi:chemotaxis protein CheX